MTDTDTDAIPDALTAVTAAVQARRDADHARTTAIVTARDAGATYREIATASGLVISHVHGIVNAP